MTAFRIWEGDWPRMEDFERHGRHARGNRGREDGEVEEAEEDDKAETASGAREPFDAIILTAGRESIELWAHLLGPHTNCFLLVKVDSSRDLPYLELQGHDTFLRFL